MNIIEKLAHKTNYGQRRNHIKFIVLHYTGNDGDRAWNNANFFQNSPNLKASAHYFVDDENIYQSVPDDYTAYSVGVDYSGGKAKYHNICTNANSLNIELCDTEKNGKYDVTERTINNAVDLLKDGLKTIKVGGTDTQMVLTLSLVGKQLKAKTITSKLMVIWHLMSLLSLMIMTPTLNFIMLILMVLGMDGLIDGWKIIKDGGLLNLVAHLITNHNGQKLMASGTTSKIQAIWLLEH